MMSINGRDLYLDDASLKQPNGERVARLLREMQYVPHHDRRLESLGSEKERRLPQTPSASTPPISPAG